MQSDNYYFDQQAADKAVKFIETFLTHVKGEWAGKPFILEEWQKNEIIRPIFGWKDDEGYRKFRKVFIFLPRKNGKSALAAALTLTCKVLDNEKGAEIYCVANEKDQAKLLFDVAKHMVLQNDELKEIIKPYQYSLYYAKINSTYKYLSAESETKDGLNSHCIVYDELHAAKNRDLYDVLDTSMGSRRQPLFIIITTAGFDKNSICYELYDYAKKVKSGVIVDETFLPVIYEADKDADIFDERTWIAANPNYKISLYKKYMEEKAQKARNIPSFENTFRRLHLNQWTASETRWINDDDWMNCDKGKVDIPVKSDCYAALDLANVRDIAAYVRLYPSDDDRFIIKCAFFVPELTAKERTQKDGVNYDTWIKQGHIIETPGNTIDYDYIERYIMESQAEDNLIGVAYDAWGASQLVSHLIDKGVNMQPWRQGYASMSAPTKEIERLTMQERLNHEGNPVLRWMCSNVMLEQDAAGNIKISKAKSSEKVDGMVSLSMAMGLYMHLNATGNGQSVYETKDMMFI